jgi:hypothetical protein
MTSSRREFVERLAFSATGAAMLGAVPSALSASPIAEASGSAAGAWDLSWTERLKGEYKVVVDSPEVEEGGGVMRASVWSKGYADAMGTKPSQCSTVLVLRHNAIVLAMSSEYWAEYKLGEKEKVNDPVTNKPAVRNPVLLNSREHGTPARYDDMALDKFIGRGNVVLGCGLAFEGMVDYVKEQDKVSDAAAKEKATRMLVPGVILQPSGVFAVVRAQQAGCWYMKGS